MLGNSLVCDMPEKLVSSTHRRIENELYFIETFVRQIIKESDKLKQLSACLKIEFVASAGKTTTKLRISSVYKERTHYICQVYWRDRSKKRSHLASILTFNMCYEKAFESKAGNSVCL